MLLAPFQTVYFFLFKQKILILQLLLSEMGFFFIIILTVYLRLN